MYGYTQQYEFTWYVKKELCEALHQYLLENLIAQYKKEVLPRGLRAKDSYEIYKWEIITRCQGQSTEFILSSHLGHGMNLIDRKYSGPVLDNLLKSDNDKTIACFNLLLKDDFSKTYGTIKRKADKLVNDRWGNKISDERMAAAFLACADPERYTFYKA